MWSQGLAGAGFCGYNFMIYIIWLTLFALFIFSFLSDKIPIWIPILCYIVIIFFRIKEKIGNYKDRLEINERDKKIKLEGFAEKMAQRGLAYSSNRNDGENKIVEDFNYERKKQKRKFENDLVNSLLLK